MSRVAIMRVVIGGLFFTLVFIYVVTDGFH